MRALEGKTVVVVGMGKGKTLGFGVADAFARAGANIAVVGRSSSGLKQAARALAEHGVRVVAKRVESCDEDIARDAANEVAAKLGGIDVLVNCTQAAKSGVPVEKLAYTDLELALETGLKSAFSWMKACLPHLRESKGCVLNFVSQTGVQGHPCQAPLAVAKEGVRALSLVAANEWASEGVRVNCVSAFARTAVFEQWAKEQPKAYEALVSELGGTEPLSLEATGDACVRVATSGQTGQVVLASEAL